MNIKSTFKLLSYIIIFVAIIMLIPTAIAYHYGEHNSAKAFLFSIALMLVFSLTGLIATSKEEKIEISAKSSYLFVTLTWLLISIFGSLPLYLSKSMPSFSLCFFEIMSGFTTTGATAIDDIEALDKSILFWRGMTNWLGGMGIVVLFIAVLPAFGVKGTALVGAESAGPTKDKLTPQIRYTALFLWGIYFALSVLQVILLLLGRLSLFDAITVTFGTMGAAGFTPKNASILGYDSAYVEWICIIFMFLSGINFALFVRIIRGSAKRALKDGELRAYTSITITVALLIAINLFAKGLYSLGTSLRLGLFETISFITTTGFTNTNYENWPIFSQALLFLLYFIGGCAGSAAGGIKVIRIVTLFKIGSNAMKMRLHPKAITNIKIGEDTVTTPTALSIAGFIFFYFMSALVATCLLTLSDKSLIVCFSAALMALGNVGLGFGGLGTSFTFSVFSAPELWLLSFLMLVGRLELFTVYSLFTRSFWKN